jgi:hypothetical protein
MSILGLIGFSDLIHGFSELLINLFLSRKGFDQLHVVKDLVLSVVEFIVDFIQPLLLIFVI